MTHPTSVVVTRALRGLVCGLALTVLGAQGCKKEVAQGDRPAGLPAASGAATPPPAPTTAPTAAAPATPPPLPPTALPVHQPGEVEAVPEAPDPKATIAGTIVLPAARKKDVAKTDTLFIIARRADGPPPGMLLAVQKHPVGDFPMPFMLSARDAMVPGTPFEGTVNLSVRIDKDGDGMTRKKGDLFGQANGLKVGTQNVTLNVDMVQKEDMVLGGAPGGAAPGGMPPGHGAPPGGAAGLPPGHP